MKFFIVTTGLFLFFKLSPVQAHKAPEFPAEGFRENHLSDDSLLRAMNHAWNISWSRFYSSKTNLFYDYLSSYKKGEQQKHLPTADEVKAQKPNLMGYDTGMEDCMISAGTMLCMVVDKYNVTRDKQLRKYAKRIFQGMRLCATAGDAGFLARCVCDKDGKSIYITSSRDQYTHAVHGLWYYYHSDLCDDATKGEIRIILSAFADRMKRNVTEANNYDFLRADGTRDTRGLSKMWNVQTHEAARLPMIYAAAWDVTRNRAYFDLYRKYIDAAIEQSSSITEWKQPTYSLLQMECSLELLAAVEPSDTLRKKIAQVMDVVAAQTINRSVNADNNAKKLDLQVLGSDWRTGEGLNSKGTYRKSWYCIRESGEAALASLSSNQPFPAGQKALLERAILRLDYDKVSSSGIFYLQAAYWKARSKGVFK